jgi:uncharacterized protein (TIGR00369 family)
VVTTADSSTADSSTADSSTADSSSTDSQVPSHWGEPRSRTVTWYDPMAAAAAGTTMSGLEFLWAIRDGTLPPAPIASLFLMRGVEAENGRVVFECEPDQSAYNPIGVVHGGLVCTLADTVAGCAVHSTLERGVGYTSIDINVSYLRPVTSESGVLRATGLVTKRGRRVAFATAEIVDGAGRVVATATSNCLVMDNRPA